MSLSSKRQFLLRELEDKSFREAYVESILKMRTALALRELRNSQNLSQDQLAEKMGEKGRNKSQVSRMENPSYGKYSMSSLLEIFNALGVPFVIEPIQFDEFVDMAEALRVPPNPPKPYSDASVQKSLGDWAEEEARR